MELKHRLVLPPMVSSFGTIEGFVSDAVIAYYKNLAKNCALCIVEATSVDWEGRVLPHEMYICDDKFIPGLKRLADTIHSVGAKAAIQLHHAGIIAYFSGLEKTWGPSKFQYPWWDPTSIDHAQELTTEQVEHIINEFAQAAVRAKQAGFDAVEVHGAGGYLVTQFLSPEMNRRTDKYGGSLENRMRFPLEIVGKMRAAVGKDYPIIYKMNADDMIEEAHRIQWGNTGIVGFRLNEGKILAPKLEQAGVDAVEVAAAHYDAAAWGVPPADMPHCCLVFLAAAIKEVVNVPVIAVGRIVTPEEAEQVLQEGKADLVSIGRGLIADDEWLQKIVEGRSQEIQWCIGCVECGRGDTYIGPKGPMADRKGHLVCSVNYKIGREDSFAITPVAKPKKIMVVGAGPAGMTAARYAAMRGHNVTLYDRENRLGGTWHYAAMMPGCADFANYTERYADWLRKLNVKIELGTEVTLQVVEEVKPDAVIVATGAVPTVPKLPGVNQPNVASYTDILSGKVEAGENVVVWCGNACCKYLSFHGCRIADYLAARGKKVTIVSTKPALVDTMMAQPSGPMFWRFTKAGVRIMTNTRLREIKSSEVVVEDKGGVRQIPTDTVVLANALSPNDALTKALRGRVAEVVVIGDADGVANFFYATNDGVRAGLEI